MGYPHYDKFNTGAHDPLYAACMYLGNGKNAAAMVTLDLLYFSNPYIMAVRKIAEEKIGHHLVKKYSTQSRKLNIF